MSTAIIAEIATFRQIKGSDLATVAQAGQAKCRFLRDTGVWTMRALSCFEKTVCAAHITSLSVQAARQTAPMRFQREIARSIFSLVETDTMEMRQAGIRPAIRLPNNAPH